MRDMTAAEGDGCMWNCRLLIQHHCHYCERERRPVPGESLSDSSPALGPEVTISHSSPGGVFVRTQFPLSLHFSKSAREVPFGFLSRLFQKGGFLSRNASTGHELVIHLQPGAGPLVIFLPSACVLNSRCA